MKYRDIPNTDLSVSTLCLGTGGFGSAQSEQEAFRLLDEFVDQGGNFLDTARVYAAWLPGGMGLSERTIGAWLRSRGNQQSIVVGTKGAHPDLSTMHIPRMSREEVTGDCEDSLRALGLEAIPLYWLHRDDDSRPVEDILETMERLVSAGKIRWYGVSNWRVNRLERAYELARSHGMHGPVANQPMWSLAQVNVESLSDPTMVWMDNEMIGFQQSSKVACIPYTSQARGFFGKAAAHGIDALSASQVRAYDNAMSRERLERLQTVSTETGWSVSAIALAYLTSQPDFVTIPIIGVSNEAQLVESLQAGDMVLSDRVLTYLMA